MRIWIVNHYVALPEDAAGTRHVDLAEELARAGHEVILWGSTFKHNDKTYRSYRWVYRDDRNGFRINWIWSSAYNRNGLMRMLNMVTFSMAVFFAGLFRTRPDVIVGSSPHLFAAMSALVLSRIYRCRFYVEVRDIWPEILVETGGLKNRFVVGALAWIERLLYRNACGIIGLTSGISQRLIDRRVAPKERIHVLRNGVKVGSWSVTRARDEVRHELGASADDFLCIYAGSHNPANGMDALVQAAELLGGRKDMHFVFIGDGQERARLAECVRTRGISRVTFLGPVPKREIPNYLQAADLLLSSFLKGEGFKAYLPNKVFDYLMSNRPIVAAMEGETPDLLAETGTGLSVEPENPSALAALLAKLADDRVWLESHAGKGQAIVQQRFAREKQAEMLAEILQNG